jgi:hypothetical protein
MNRYNFRTVHQSLFVISSSTTGGLEQALRQRLHVPGALIVTVIYLNAGARVDPSVVLCNLSKAYEERIREFISFPAENCPSCKSHIPAVAIGGDQFLVDISTPETFPIRAEDKPKWLQGVLTNFIGKDVLRVHRITRTGRYHPRELFVDLERIIALPANRSDSFAGSEYRRVLARRLKSVTPMGLRHIICVDEPSGRALANRIYHSLPAAQKRRVTVTPHSQLPRKDIDRSPLSKGIALVVSGVIITGQTLMEINQLLRDRTDDSIVYMAGLTRTGSQTQLNEIVSNIQFGSDGGRHYPFTSALDIFLPDNHIDRLSPWDVECNTWMSLRELISDEPGRDEVYRWCTERIDFLKQAQVKGITSKLFISDMSGNHLHLRGGFALWRGIKYEETSYSQADVYFTISAVLHNWRRQHREIVSGQGRRILIAPRTFFRFNDGIIQACLLRAAEPGELDYRASPELSSAMVEVLSVIFTHCKDSQGEAALEFLLALDEHRLSIEKGKLSPVLVKLEDQLKGAGDVLSRLAVRLIGRILDAQAR